VIVPVFHHLEEVSSTNDIAIAMAIEGAEEGTVVTAKHQTKGRGRGSRVWLDEAGQNLIMSIILRPDISKKHVSDLSFIVSLGVIKYLRNKFRLAAFAKWPNDILVSSKKISGILLESVKTKENLCAVAGIGLNVFQREFSEEIKGKATSLALENESVSDITKISFQLSISILETYQDYLEKGFPKILSEWEKHLWGIGKSVDLCYTGLNESGISGIILGVDKEGALILRDNSGEIRHISAGEITN
jgi:BirA family transcriptional regulator, biotin operon repressor / biotin---[acetyl-CoA-carboxylase] ligase